jgi:hypothetical protein
MVPSTTGPRSNPPGPVVIPASVGCYDPVVTDVEGENAGHPGEGDPNEPHEFLAADTYVPLGPFSGGGAAIRGLLTPETVATGREDRCALCGRPADDPIHQLGAA